MNRVSERGTYKAVAKLDLVVEDIDMVGEKIMENHK